MKALRGIQTRPWAVTLTVAVLLALVLLVIPVSYQRTVGHEVSLKISNSDLGAEQIDKIASEFRSALMAENLSVSVEADAPPTITARVPGSSRVQVDRVSGAFVKGLAAQGICATAQVTPRLERVLGNLYAYARDNIIAINVSTAGRSEAQVEAEIRSQLEAAGLQNPTVEYKTNGDQTTLKVMLQKTGAACDTSVCPHVEVSLDGHHPGDGQSKGKEARIEIRRTAGMTDEEVIAQVKQQLKDQGVDADVTMENGMIQVHPRKP